jgi:DNA helicase-2/ATP-dependent DNA helicase PcrA
VDLGTDNHRNAGTDIAAFGSDILKGTFHRKRYEGVEIITFPSNAAQAFSKLATTTHIAQKRLVDAGTKEWSLAILVPTKKMTRLVSDAFRAPPGGIAEIPHSAVIELEAAILGAEVIALLMQPIIDGCHFDAFITLMRNYFHGKGGDTPTKRALNEAAGIQKAYDEHIACLATGKGLRRNSILVAMRNVYGQARELALTGDPDKDWRAMRRLLEDGACPRLKEIAEEVRNIRLLERGTPLRQALSQDWRDNGAYRNALAIIRHAFIQEHFSTNARPETGVVVMNMHKAKGKQFDEVIIFEGWPIGPKGKPPYNADRIVRFNSRAEIDDQSRQNLRVSVTRGKRHATIMTPEGDPCVLLLEND